MPYVPSEKTKNPSGIVKDGKAQDRILIDKDVKELSVKITNIIVTNNDIAKCLFVAFKKIGYLLYDFATGIRCENDGSVERKLADTIWEVGKAYNYEGAFLGELNYAMTRLIQEVPKRLVEMGKQKGELRYFIYALTVSALVKAVNYFDKKEIEVGITGVFEDIKDEYKWRVNRSYEAAQIVKSGDCYDSPYFTKLVKVVDKEGELIGYFDLCVANDGKNVKKDILGEITMDLK